MSLIEQNPDVYGLFWILITWITVLAFCRVFYQSWVYFIVNLVNILGLT